MPCLYCGSQFVELSDSLYCSFCGFSLNFPYTTWEIIFTINSEQMRILREEEPPESQLDFNLELSVSLLEEKLTEVLREHLSDSPFTLNSLKEIV